MAAMPEVMTCGRLRLALTPGPPLLEERRQGDQGHSQVRIPPMTAEAHQIPHPYHLLSLITSICREALPPHGPVLK